MTFSEAIKAVVIIKKVCLKPVVLVDTITSAKRPDDAPTTMGCILKINEANYRCFLNGGDGCPLGLTKNGFPEAVRNL